MDPVLEAIRGRAAADQATLGLLLMGSRAIGSPLPDSDYDVLWVLTDEGMEARAARGEPREAKEGNVDVSYIGSAVFANESTISTGRRAR